MKSKREKFLHIYGEREPALSPSHIRHSKPPVPWGPCVSSPLTQQGWKPLGQEFADLWSTSRTNHLHHKEHKNRRVGQLSTLAPCWPEWGEKTIETNPGKGQTTLPTAPPEPAPFEFKSFCRHTSFFPPRVEMLQTEPHCWGIHHSKPTAVRHESFQTPTLLLCGFLKDLRTGYDTVKPPHLLGKRHQTL